MRFSGKTVFVTGASSGIGREIAKAFMNEGAYVVGASRSSAFGELFCNQWYRVDFYEINQIKSCGNFIKELKPDILINSAGINMNASFVDINLDQYSRIQQVNVLAPLLLCQAAIPSMKTKGWGRIINISSIWGKISMAKRAAYSASKFALDGITLALASEHASDGIIANCISPGFIDTELTRRNLSPIDIEALVSKVPIARLGKPEEISQFVLWLSSKENTFISGQNIAIDGGFTRV